MAYINAETLNKEFGLSIFQPIVRATLRKDNGIRLEGNSRESYKSYTGFTLIILKI